MCRKVGLAKSLSTRYNKKIDDNNNQISHSQKKLFGNVPFMFAINVIYIDLTRHELSILHYKATLQFQQK